MKQYKIDQFFKLLNRQLDEQAQVILVGASAGSLMGHIRPSVDIDFEIRLKGARKSNPEVQQKLLRSIKLCAELIRVAVNFSENIAGWSMINYLNYRTTALPYKKIGKLDIKLIAPEYWTIGKMARYHELDIQDMKKILKAKKVKPETVIRLWARAVRSSDLSLELGHFRDHVIEFLDREGTRIWGKTFDIEAAKKDFQKKISKK